MNYNKKDFSIKGFVASLLIHLSLVGSYLLYTQDKPKKIANKEKLITINLQNCDLPKQNILKPEFKPIKKVNQKPKKKPIQKKKEIVKPKPKKLIQKKKEILKQKPKEVAKPKTEPKDEIEKPLEDVTKQELKTEVFQSKTVEKPQDTKNTIEMQQQAFIQTNFTIIRNMVLSNLSYPRIARKMGWQGVVKVRLVIDKNGKLLSYKIIESSDKKRLDQAALDAVESIKNKILPKPKARTTIILPISFKLQ